MDANNTSNTSKPIPFEWNERTKAILMWSLIASVVLHLINTLGGYISARYFVTSLFSQIDPSGFLNQYSQAAAPTISFDFIGPIKSGIFAGLITAAMLYWFYPKIFAWVQRQAFGKYLNTFFKIMFYPYLIGVALFTLLTAWISLKGTLVIVAFMVAAHFVYAKILASQIGHYFTEPMPSAPASPSVG